MENKSYYDWLEVSPKASQEVIEKAYKVLVKKYHPDLQDGTNQEAENNIRKINEAYSVLSDKNKREEYDTLLVKEHQKYTTTQNNNTNYDMQKQNSNNQDYPPTDKELNQEQVDYELEYQRQVENARRKAYQDAYIQDMKNRGYKIRYKKSFKDYLRIIITILAIFIIIWILWQIPFVRNWINTLSENNFVIKIIVDIIRSIYEALFEVFV